MLEDVLIRRALTGEADFFWKRLARRPAGAGAGDQQHDRLSVTDRASDAQQLPPALRSLAPGYHAYRAAWRRDRSCSFPTAPAGRLYLVFNQEQVGRLAFLFGFVPLILVLIDHLHHHLAHLSRLAARAVAGRSRWPRSCATGIRNSPTSPRSIRSSISSDPDGDVETLARALHGFASRIEEFVERERNFTRDASHEMRSPLTVIKVAAEVLQEEELSPFAQRTVERIQRSARDMEALMEAFLILARESDTGLPEEDFVVNDAVREEVERAQPLVVGRPVDLRARRAGQRSRLHAPPKVFAVLVGNLIRNACLYTEHGEVRVTRRHGFRARAGQRHRHERGGSRAGVPALSSAAVAASAAATASA